ncbi:hypothetical protein R3P38DRAFT_2952983 [Favolaschia claudopus]|uniref:RING-type domain-containing protein n=1 Tax=Favolaschia claudopus TaxID=2862362 RepID=A0AAW0BHZ3_9AGAR
MVQCHCQVCWSDYSVDAFRHLICGHCFCVACITKIQQTNASPACPACRAPIAINDPQPIYLDLVADKPLARVVAEGITRMDADSKLVSVRTAERKLRQTVEEMEEREEAAGELRVALADFSDRIVPLFKRARSQTSELLSLKKKLEEIEGLRAQAERATALAGEVTILRETQVKLREEARDANARCDHERARVETSRAEVQRAREAEAQAHGEVHKLKGFLERGAQDRNSHRSKLRAVMEERDALQQQLQQLRNEMQRRDYSSSTACDDDDDDLEIEEEVLLSDDLDEDPQPQRVSTVAKLTPLVSFEGMARPGFGSDWQIGRGTKRKERDEPPPSGFPIALNHGRTTVAVQLGPKHSRRVKVRLG